MILLAGELDVQVSERAKHNAKSKTIFLHKFPERFLERESASANAIIILKISNESEKFYLGGWTL